MEGVADGIVTRKPKKRTAHPENWRKNVAKTSKAAGLGYIKHYTMNAMPPRAMQNISCRHNCENLLSQQEKDEVFNRFNNLNDHVKQNLYLQGCIGKTAQRNCKITCIGRTVFVCTKYFLGLHGIAYSRLRNKVLQPTVPIDDLRGKHPNNRRTSEDVLNSVRTFLKNLPARESHYSIAANPHRKYVEANLTMKKLYLQLINDENTLANAENLKVWQFRKIFNYEFNIGIGFPRSDVCETCESHQCNIKSSQLNGNIPQLQNRILLQRRHHEESEMFYKKMSKERQEFNDPSYAFYCFDYEKNLPFPVTNIGKEFFLRQLWLYNFTIHNLKTGDAYMFVYTENFGNKGSSETVSFLKYFVEHFIAPEVQHLRLFSDNSGGQNKNRYMFAYLQSLCVDRFTSLEMCLPLPGHSRMQVDSDFALIEKRKRKEDKIHFPSEWINIIRSARMDKPFQVIFGNHSVTDDLINDGTPIATIFNFKESLEDIILPAPGINQVRQMRFQRGSFHPLISPTLMVDCTQPFRILKDYVTPEMLSNILTNTPPAYEGYLPVTKEKYDNVSFLTSKFYKPPEKTFYTSIFARRVEETDQQRIMREVMSEYNEPIDISFLE